jgi:hypothetical protein
MTAPEPLLEAAPGRRALSGWSAARGPEGSVPMVEPLLEAAPGRRVRCPEVSGPGPGAERADG